MEFSKNLIISCYATETVASAAKATAAAATPSTAAATATTSAEVIYFYGFVRISNVAIKWLLPHSLTHTRKHIHTHTNKHVHAHTRSHALFDKVNIAALLLE